LDKSEENTEGIELERNVKLKSNFLNQKHLKNINEIERVSVKNKMSIV
jgi:hypothetical protein